MLSHKKTKVVTFADLCAMPIPPSLGPWHAPVPHEELVRTICSELTNLGVACDPEEVPGEFAVGKHSIFGFIQTPLAQDGLAFSVAFRSDNAQRFGVRIVGGTHVFVCDNMAITGDWIICSKKHTTGLDLPAQVATGLAEARRRFADALSQAAEAKATYVSDRAAKSLLFDLVREGALPSRLMVDTYQEFQTPRHEDFESGTLWALSNAVTEMAKHLPLHPRLRLLTALSKKEQAFLS